VCLLEGSEEQWHQLEAVHVENLFVLALVFETVVAQADALQTRLHVEHWFLTHVRILGLIVAGAADIQSHALLHLGSCDFTHVLFQLDVVVANLAEFVGLQVLEVCARPLSLGRFGEAVLVNRVGIEGPVGHSVGGVELFVVLVVDVDIEQLVLLG